MEPSWGKVHPGKKFPKLINFFFAMEIHFNVVLLLYFINDLILFNVIAYNNKIKTKI